MPGRRRRSRAPLAFAVLGLLAAVIVVLVLALGSGGSTPQQTANRSGAKSKTSAGRGRRGSHSAQAGSPASGSSTSRGSSAASGSSAAASPDAGNPSGSGSPSIGAGNPVSATEAFYRLAAEHRYSQAWALADPAFQGQLGGYQSFQSTFSGERSISFLSTRTVGQSGDAATVAIDTRSVRTDGTQSCSGTVELVSGGSNWRLHQIHVSCSPS